MSEVYEAFSKSNAWDSKWNLPICPGTHNPWIYSAYALKVMRSAGLTATEDVRLQDAFRGYADACRIKRGLFNRTPEGGHWTSHDELMGMAYVLPELAREIAIYLEETGGVYTNLEVDAARPDAFYAFNVYRFVWFKPYLKARAGYYVNPIDQFVFAAHVWNDARITKPGLTTDAGGRLRIWIMLEAMESRWISGLSVWHWRNKMASLGYTPKNQLKIEPGNYSILGEYAPGSF